MNGCSKPGAHSCPSVFICGSTAGRDAAHAPTKDRSGPGFEPQRHGGTEPRAAGNPLLCVSVPLWFNGIVPDWPGHPTARAVDLVASGMRKQKDPCRKTTTDGHEWTPMQKPWFRIALLIPTSFEIWTLCSHGYALMPKYHVRLVADSGHG